MRPGKIRFSNRERDFVAGTCHEEAFMASRFAPPNWMFDSGNSRGPDCVYFDTVSHFLDAGRRLSPHLCPEGVLPCPVFCVLSL